MNRLQAFGNLVLYYIFTMILPSVLIAVAIIENRKDLVGYAFLVPYFMLIGIIVLINFDYLKTSAKNYTYTTFNLALISIVFYIIIVTVIAVFFSLLGIQDTSSTNQADLEELFKLINPVWMVLLTTFCAPFIEEITFRASIVYLIGGKNIFKNKKGLILCLLSSLIIFVMLHISTELGTFIAGESSLTNLVVVAYPYATVSSFLVILFGIFEGNIFASMGLHFMVNALATVAILGSLAN